MSIAFAYLACALIWGTTWFAIRVSIGPEGYPTFAAAALRFTAAAAVVVPLCLAGLGRPGPGSRREWVWLGLAGLLNAIGYALVYRGEETVPGGLAAVLFCTEPLWVALLVTLTRTERVTRAELGGSLIALAGIGAIFWDRLQVSPEQVIGLILILTAVVSTSLYSVIVKRHASGVHPLASTAVFLVVTTGALWVAALGFGWEPLPWPPPARATIALLYLGVFGSVIGFASLFYLFKRISLMATSSLVFVLTVIALLVDALWEDAARLTGRTYLGIAITMGGVLFAVLLRPRAEAGQPGAASAQ